VLTVTTVSAGLTATTLFLGFARALLFFNILVKSSQALHSRMFRAILRTPVLFFDVNPIGRHISKGEWLGIFGIR